MGILTILLWLPAAVVMWIAKIIGAVLIVPLSLLLKTDLRDLPIWGNKNGIPPDYDTGFWKRWVWFAVRNGAHNLSFGDMPNDWHQLGNIDETRPGFNVRWRRAGWRSSFRIAWGKPDRQKGKKEFYIGFKLTRSADFVKVTFFQLRPAWILPLIVAVLFFAMQARAGDASLSWTNPTEQESCTGAGPLPDLAGTRIYRLVTDIPDPTATSWVDIGLKPGTYEYVATSYDADGTNSRLSGAATKEITTFVAAAGALAYGISQSNDRIVLQPVGTVTAEIACNLDESVNGKHRIPISSVTYAGSLRPATVFAECG